MITTLCRGCFAFASLLALLPVQLPAADSQSPVSIHFAAQVNGRDFACGQTFPDIGVSHSTIKPKDFRFFVSAVRLVDAEGVEVPLTMEEGTKWQAQDVALLDFENGSGLCINGTEETNDTIRGTVSTGHTWKALRFTLGVPFTVNHMELTSLPSPLNLTAMNWVWNAGHKFARIEFASTGQPRGYFFHLGSTGCKPDTTKTTVPTSCASPNRPEITIDGFDPARDTVIADIGALLSDSKVDMNTAQTPSGCMSFADDPDCNGIFKHLGLAYADQPAGKQDFFRRDASHASTARNY